ncbi:MAG: arylesterase [Flavobacteriaceae bacterium]|nr:MAG: arylesterase [Flavobacteriaceae bacterium]
MCKILKFSYFFICLLLISCGDKTKKETENPAEEEISLQNTAVTTSDNDIILFFGDSLSAGYGLDNEEDAFPYLIQQKLDSLQLNYTVVNSGLSGETTSGGKNRLDWVLTQQVDVFVLELGANDGLRGIPLSETRNNLQVIIDAVIQKNAETKIILAGMQIPPNMGQDYTTEFRNIFPELAEKNKVALIPFLLDKVGGIPELNQGDGIHPTIEGHKIVAQNVWNVLQHVIMEKDTL